MADQDVVEPGLEFTPVVPQRAFEDIAEQIRGLIASGRLKPGDRLPAERKLSVQFNVSRNTVREAFRALELSGMIELRKGAYGGAFVLPGSPDVIVNGLLNLYHLGAISPVKLTEARIWLNTIVVRVACERMTEEDLARLEANVEAAAQAQKAGDFDARARIQLDFYVILARMTQNPIIEAVMQAVMGVMAEFIRSIGPGDNAHAIQSRKRLLKHFRARDAEAAVEEMTKLQERLHAGYLTLWESKGKK